MFDSIKRNLHERKLSYKDQLEPSHIYILIKYDWQKFYPEFTFTEIIEFIFEASEVDSYDKEKCFCTAVKFCSKFSFIS